MKTVLAAALALLAGLFLGGIGPRAELRQTRKDLVEAREAAARGGPGSFPLAALGLGGLAAVRDRARSVPRFVPSDAGTPPSPAEEREPRRRRPLAQGSAEGLQAAKVAVDVRAAQFRAAFVGEARLSPEREAHFDRTIETMNQELARAADELALALRERPPGHKVRPREMADIGVRLLEVYRRADDTFSAGLDDAGKVARDRTQFDLLTQVDLGSFRTLAETLEAVGVSDLGRP